MRPFMHHHSKSRITKFRTANNRPRRWTDWSKAQNCSVWLTEYKIKQQCILKSKIFNARARVKFEVFLALLPDPLKKQKKTKWNETKIHEKWNRSLPHSDDERDDDTHQLWNKFKYSHTLTTVSTSFLTFNPSSTIQCSSLSLFIQYVYYNIISN